jgi:HK97 family phage portal protein
MSNIFQRIFKTKEKVEERSFEEWNNPVLGTLNFSSYSSYNSNKALKLSTVFRCTNLISDSIASLPFNPYNYVGNWKYIDYTGSTLYNLLNVQPNQYMSKFTFMKQLVTYMLLQGNAFVYIDRNKKGEVLALTLLNSDYVQMVYMPAKGEIIPYTTNLAITSGDIGYKDTLTGKIYDKSQIIHILNYSIDGYYGQSTLSFAATQLGIAYDTDQHSGNFFKGGANLAGILRPLAGVNITAGKAKQAKSDFISALSSDLGGQSNSIVVLDSGLEYQPITVSPKDSQMIENKQFNVIDICRFFNVPPSLAFSETGKFSTAEQQQIDYLTNCLQPVIEKLENEFFRKLYLPSEWNFKDLKFDVENLIRLDATTKANVMVQLHSVGGYTTNEIREKLNATYPVAGGNRAFVQVNLQPTDNLISENPTNTNNQIDNKLKQ